MRNTLGEGFLEIAQVGAATRKRTGAVIAKLQVGTVCLTKIGPE